MRRVHAFEFNELASCPRAVRESIVETLGLGLRWGRVLDGVGPVFADFCARARCAAVLDLCSGSGEPVSILLDALARQGLQPPRFLLSDLYPNVAAMRRVAARHPGLVEVVDEPVDACDVPARHDQPARTIVNALHHLPPAAAARLVADSVARRRALFVAEGFPRSLRRMAATLPAMLAAGAVNPWVAPRDRWQKLLVTWATPAVAATGLWDAAVSALRMYSEAELRAMAAGANDYEWQYREVPFFPGGRATVFWGIPRA
ncbi:MAG: hypothetical protein HY906_22370 [Deltaproteobacteria bacterium]|nr:hypothetical protein [Deltaproteobacteria bacterium]